MDLDQSNWIPLNKSTYHLPRQKNCAVVGNSGILRNSACGEDIDSNDFVFRCNVPDVDNYVKDVGHKTNVNIVFQTTMLELYDLCTNATLNESTLAERLNVLNGSIIWYPESFKSKIVTNETVKLVLKCIETKFNLQFQFAVSALGFTGNMRRLLNLKKPTTGMRAIVAALSLCEHVNVYGFYPYIFDQNGKNVSYHYYGPFFRLDSFDTSHNYSAEFHTLQTLDNRNVLRLFTNDCKH
uniref:Alpha-2,8-sialyltransferase 8B-like n=1 Tax=Saccoglossus kowalevskii TaxID=10224 RepID=A0ABM0MYE8_SACKO|nr:PREDICTED: alpha-2,8-sialyltransferase 8B-like [Saccoglossus kowalevskii]